MRYAARRSWILLAAELLYVAGTVVVLTALFWAAGCDL